MIIVCCDLFIKDRIKQTIHTIKVHPSNKFKAIIANQLLCFLQSAITDGSIYNINIIIAAVLPISSALTLNSSLIFNLDFIFKIIKNKYKINLKKHNIYLFFYK